MNAQMALCNFSNTVKALLKHTKKIKGEPKFWEGSHPIDLPWYLCRSRVTAQAGIFPCWKNSQTLFWEVFNSSESNME